MKGFAGGIYVTVWYGIGMGMAWPSQVRCTSVWWEGMLAEENRMQLLFVSSLNGMGINMMK